MDIAVSCKKEKITKTLLKVLIIVLSVYWIAFGGVFAVRQVLKTFVYPLKYTAEVNVSSEEYGLEQALVYAIIKEESGFKKEAESKKGAIGLMQIMESTATKIAKERRVATYDLKNAKTNIDFGCYYLRYLIDKFGDLDTAVVSYNAGEGNVSRWLSDARYSANGKTLTIIPFKESERYLKRVKNSYKKYKNLYIISLDKK